MDAKSFIKNKSICTLPWSGFLLETDGRVKNCILAKDKIGDTKTDNIKDIMQGKKNVALKEAMLKDKQPSNCEGCYMQEKGRNDLSSISSRLYYLKELGNKIDLKFYDNTKNFDLKHVDLRWTNSCNQACVYCDPKWSSKWAQEMGVKVKSTDEAKQQVKDYVFDNIENLENVYLAGGEPMLMKENKELLTLLKEKNPNCNIRVNTNLSKLGTGVFELLCNFKNVHWTVSVESIKEKYEYIRFHGSWKDFEDNLNIIKKLDHKISFNMLHFILNHKELYNCIDHLKAKGFNDNSFIIGPMFWPHHFNILNLPEKMLLGIIKKLKTELSMEPQGYLKNSYENLLSYYTTTPWKKNIKSFYYNIGKMDQRRNQNSREVFKDLFDELDDQILE